MNKPTTRTVIIILLILVMYVQVSTAKPLPYNIVNNSLEVDGSAYWENGIKQTKTGIEPYTIDDYNYAVRGSVYKSYFSQNMSKDTAFFFEYDGTNVSFVPKSIYLQSNPQAATKAQTVTGAVIASTIEYPGMFGAGTTYKLTTSDTLIKEELILNSNPYPAAADTDTLIFKHRFNYSSLTPYINGAVWDGTSVSTNSTIIFKKNSETYFAFAKPYATDAAGNTTELSYDVSQNSQTGEMNIKLNTPMSFMKNATYPVIIDPSLEQSGGSTTLDGTWLYDFVNITNGGIVYVTAYTGTGTTGTLILNVTYDVNIDVTSSINGAARGLTGGANGRPGQGGLTAGAGGGGNGEVSNGAGGGGGGGHGTAGTPGGAGKNGAGGSAGAVKGTTTGQDIDMGSGAGGGGKCNTDTDDCLHDDTAGQNGGAALTINAGRNITIFGSLVFTGGNGGHGESGKESYNPHTCHGWSGGGGSGAAGGGVKLNASNTININSATINLGGGGGGAAGTCSGDNGNFNGQPGSVGGDGRFKVFYKISFSNTSTGLTTGTAYYENTNTAPTVPVLTSHASYHTAAATTLTWSASTDGQGDTLTYEVKAGTTTGGTDVLNYAGDTDTTSTAFDMTPLNSYYWSVRACDPYVCSSWATESSFSFSNNIPTIQNVSIYPMNATVTSNLTASMNASDADSDSLTKYYEWYKNGVKNTSWNNLTYINYTGANFTTSDSIYVVGWVNDTFSNSGTSSSNTVIIDSGNSPPTLTGISLNPSDQKYNKTIWINSSAAITDAESSQVIYRTYYKFLNGTKAYLGNSTWFTPPAFANVSVTIPWRDGTIHTIYAAVEDSGNVLGLNNMTSSEVTATFTSNTSSGTMSASSATPGEIYTGATVTISATFNGVGANISSAKVYVERPDATAANWTMTCGAAATTVTCTKTYTATSSLGYYYMSVFYPLDDSGDEGAISSELAFSVQQYVGGSTGGGGGGGGRSSTTIIVQNITASNATTPSQLTWRNITTGATEPEATALSKCLTDSLIMKNYCSGYNFGVVIEPFNWWVAFGAFVGAAILLVIKSSNDSKRRDIVTDTITFGLVTTLVVAALVGIGFNAFFVNYLMDSALYFWTFVSFIAWGMLGAAIADSLVDRKWFIRPLEGLKIQ